MLSRSISTYQIPTWITPLVVLLFTTALIPNTSLLGHLLSIGVGYACMLSHVQKPLKVDSMTNLYSI